MASSWRWLPPAVATRHVRKHGRNSGALLVAMVACVSYFNTLRSSEGPTASGVSFVNTAPSPEPTTLNATWSSSMLLPLELELWQKRRLRIRLLRILGAASETKRNVVRMHNLEQQGPDGSRLIQSTDIDDKDNAPLAPPSSPPPRELVQLLEVEDRIRCLRHARRIVRARRAAAKSTRRLVALRRHPVQRVLLRSAQLAGAAAVIHSGAIPGAIQGGAAAAAELGDQLGGLFQRSLEWLGIYSIFPADALAKPFLPEELALPLTRVVDIAVQHYLSRVLLRFSHARKGSPVQLPDVALDDVAGIGPAKAEALEIVECLMSPARFLGLGARCPKGLLLTGPPGCGKTLLAKAIASTAAVPFIAKSGSDFIDRWAGVGTLMVKELFRVARSVAPSVVLIDELDYIGRKRGDERGGGLETDRSAALTQFLTEMDGFASAEGILIIGTTNRADILDKALLRPGRFDRHVRVPLPDVRGRLKILRTHAQRLPAESDQPWRLTAKTESVPMDGPGVTDWHSWAKRTSGFSGADLAGLVNEAAMAAAREGARGVGERHVQAAYDKALIGIPSGRRPSVEQQRLTAAHEAGHAVVNEAMRAAISLDGFRTVAHMSIVPAGGTGGVTQFAEPEDGKGVPESRQVLLAFLAVAMGGRAAEELHIGKGGATMGAQSDFEDATRLATDMIMRGGLSDMVGPRSFAVGSPSQDLLRRADEEVNRLLTAALSAARRSLTENKVLLDAVTDALMDHETLDAAAFQRLVEQHHVKGVSV